MNRIFEFWVGAQASGKTYQLRRRALALADRPSIRRVIVLAPPGEWRDLADPVDLADLGRALVDWGLPREPVIPRVTLGDHAALEKVCRVAASWGDCAILIDEAAIWIPSQLSVESLRRRNPALFAALVRGRHIERADGLERPTHLVFAAQYARSVHHLISDQAATIMVSRPDGEYSRDWIRGHSDGTTLARALALGVHQWTPIRGRDPRRG